MPRLSLLLLVIIVLLSFTGAFFYTADPYHLDQNAILLSPSWQHPFGTDRLGRDLFARVIEGGKISLIIGVGSALIASFIGMVLGA